MPRRRPDDKADHPLDELLSDYSIPEQILGEQGLLKRLVERAAFHHSSRFCCRRSQESQLPNVALFEVLL